jgi:hypothetical protein
VLTPDESVDLGSLEPPQCRRSSLCSVSHRLRLGRAG